MDDTDNESVYIGITLESFQSVTPEMAKTQVYLIQIMEHLSLPEDGKPTGNNPGNKSGASSETTVNFLSGTKEYRTVWNDPEVPCEDRRRFDMHQTIKGTQQIIKMTLKMTPKTDACMGSNGKIK